MKIVLVGNEELADQVTQCLPSQSWSLNRLPTMLSAVGWLTAFHADLVVYDSRLLESDPARTIEELSTLPLMSCLVHCVIHGKGSEESSPRFGTNGVWNFVLERDAEIFRDFLAFLSRRDPVPLFNCGLTGTIPSAGIRQIVHILGITRRSGRMAVFNGGTSPKQHILWIKSGEFVLSDLRSSEGRDDFEQIAAIHDGWFHFMDADVDEEMLGDARKWYDRANGVPATGESLDEDHPGLNLRDEFKRALSSAKSLREVEDVLRSFLEMSIDRAAEHEDVMLMDKLADLSILLEKEELGKALHLLRELRE